MDSASPPARSRPAVPARVVARVRKEPANTWPKQQLRDRRPREASGPSTAQRCGGPPDSAGLEPWRLPVRNDPSWWSNARGLCQRAYTREVTGYARSRWLASDRHAYPAVRPWSTTSRQASGRTAPMVAVLAPVGLQSPRAVNQRVRVLTHTPDQGAGASGVLPTRRAGITTNRAAWPIAGATATWPSSSGAESPERTSGSRC